MKTEFIKVPTRVDELNFFHRFILLRRRKIHYQQCARAIGIDYDRAMMTALLHDAEDIDFSKEVTLEGNEEKRVQLSGAGLKGDDPLTLANRGLQV